MPQPAPRPLDVLALGNAIVDVISSTPDELLVAQGLTKGTMALIDAGAAELLYRAMGPGTESSGGSAANTAAGVASFGGTAGFVGKVTGDLLGQVFTHDIRASGVEFVTAPAASGSTARCLILVTPDAERTLNTHLGVAGDVRPADIDPDQVARADILYVEGYLCGLPTTRDTLAKAVEVAHSAGRRVALSLSDPAWVELHHDELSELIDDVDVLFGNEAEALGLCGTDRLDLALADLRQRCELVVLTRGPAGSVVASGAEEHSVPAAPVDHLVDTTGAGDLFAAGFLFGLTRGLDLERCARLGGIAAAEIISHLGARPQTPLAALAAETGLL
jgi:sugar/nucleoside kinase (ribokinase family)